MSSKKYDRITTNLLEYKFNSENPLNDNEILILSHINSLNLSKLGYCSKTNERLSEDFNLNKRTITTIINKLIDNGFLLYDGNKNRIYCKDLNGKTIFHPYAFERHLITTPNVKELFKTKNNNYFDLPECFRPLTDIKSKEKLILAFIYNQFRVVDKDYTKDSIAIKKDDFINIFPNRIESIRRSVSKLKDKDYITVKSDKNKFGYKIEIFKLTQKTLELLSV